MPPRTVRRGWFASHNYANGRVNHTYKNGAAFSVVRQFGPARLATVPHHIIYIIHGHHVFATHYSATACFNCTRNNHREVLSPHSCGPAFTGGPKGETARSASGLSQKDFNSGQNQLGNHKYGTWNGMIRHRIPVEQHVSPSSRESHFATFHIQRRVLPSLDDAKAALSVLHDVGGQCIPPPRYIIH